MSSSVRSRSVVPQSTGDTQHNVRDAALIGATSAFAKSPAKPQQVTNTYTGGSNGALLAATKVGTGWPSTSAGIPAPLQRDYTGGSSRSVSRPHPPPQHVSSSSSLGVPDNHVDRAPSPSYTAAKLAAARLSPLRPTPQAKAAAMMSERYANERDVLPPSGSVGDVLARLEQQKPSQQRASKQLLRRRDSIGSQSAASAAVQDKPTDDTPIPPTNSLVNMFEQNRPVTPTQPPSAPSVVVKNSPPPVKSPKPRRNFTLPPEPTDDVPLVRKSTHTPPPVPKSNPSIELPRPQFVDGTRDSSPSSSQTQDAPLKSPPIKQKPAQLAALNTKVITGPTSSGHGRPMSQDSRRSATFNRRFSTSASGSVYHKPYQRESVKAISKHMTGESLSSAIMGAALASSRTSSPNPPQPMTIEPLFPPRKQHHHHMPFHRSPSPQKASPPKTTGKLRTTMRKDPSPPSSSDDEIEFKGKGNRIMGMKVRKHPNKHHEGQRKRWRDQITERERKRYEGVWAANKGILLPASKFSYPPDDDPSMDVLNLVVREIWMRSRLPTHVLEEVWTLVDGRDVGRLTRVEFVVGLWLVDQRLKGRKLPTRVSDSVWTSARGLGIKVKVRG
ncbi:hypothetical protein EJ07DRAFT_118695 [Lizonia empirigonia]|nr:hypothetical protein EJ07DRAFT_118695 [Lizonia empirigonia]